VMSLERGVERSSSRSAKMLGLKDRGTIAAGMFADVAVFDYERLTDKATYEEPRLLAEGMEFVFVNGVLAVEGGTYTGALAGRVLRR